MVIALDTTVEVLGTQYHVYAVSEAEDERMKNRYGYTDWTTKEIGIEKNWIGDVGNKAEHIQKTIRHELVHAFMFESGLGDSFEHGENGQEETTVDWFAFQMNKIQNAASKIYKEVKWE